MKTYPPVMARMGLLLICSAALVSAVNPSGHAADQANQSAKKKILLIAGKQSHLYAQHEFDAGCMLLAKCLNDCGLPIEAVVVKDGWLADPKVFDGASAIVIYCDGGESNIVMGHLEQLDELVKKGVGIGAIHYAVEVPKGTAGSFFLDWLGGYFETDWSVNPTWTAEFKQFPTHPVTRGVKPFAIKDEWYFHMRFQETADGFTSILNAVPPASTMSRKDGPHEGNPTVRKEVADGLPQTMGWVKEWRESGRAFGLTGGHYHWNWGNDNFRKLALNMIAWIAKVDIPAAGVPSPSLTVDELMANMDPKKPLPEFSKEEFQKKLDEWKSSN